MSEEYQVSNSKPSGRLAISFTWDWGVCGTTKMHGTAQTVGNQKVRPTQAHVCRESFLRSRIQLKNIYMLLTVLSK